MVCAWCTSVFNVDLCVSYGSSESLQMFGKRLAEERRRLGRSQDDFAQIIDIGRSGYASIEVDRAPLDVSRLMTLGEKADVDVLYVLFGEPTSQAAGNRLDWTLVEGILKGMHSWATEHNINIPPQKQMLLLKLLYQKLALQGQIDVQSLEDTLKLVA